MMRKMRLIAFFLFPIFSFMFPLSLPGAGLGERVYETVLDNGLKIIDDIEPGS